ncbi:MAG: HlyD family efflux transporter periplasmic adaptor subunit [Leptolyngbyaceae cyanobacterium CSU_1_3]|nr:HlyD family efflux transporter periplasmic adaptor subunit [Leptolyngbyaceae cyanobacterium CSU_1_3]
MNSAPSSDRLRPVQVDEFLPPVGRWTTIGSLALLSTFGVGLVLAAVTRYPVTVKAAAIVRPVGEQRLVQTALEGTVSQIEVQENQPVNEGQIIARLQDSQLQTQKAQLQNNLRQNAAQSDQINAQISALDGQIVAETRLVDRTIASAQSDLSNNQRSYRDRQIIAEANLQEAASELKLAQEQFLKYRQAAAVGVIAQIQVGQKEQAVKAAEAKLKRAQAEVNPTNATVAIAQERIAQEQAKGEASLATLRRERELLIQRRIDLQSQISRDQKELQQLDIELQKTTIRATAAGTILKLNIRNPGQTVKPGDAIAQITPRSSALTIKARVNAQDISKVKVGQPVQMRVSAFPYPDYGTLRGTVSALPSDITQQPNASEQAAPGYEVTIAPEHLYLAQNPKNALQPGMEGTAEIISRDETLLAFMLRKARLTTDL